MIPPTLYIVQDRSGRQFASVFSDNREAIKKAVLAGVESWLNEILYVPRDELKGRPDTEIYVRIMV